MVPDDPARPRWRDRFAQSVGRWAARRVERRAMEEWNSFRQPPELKARWFRRDAPHPRAQNFRSLVQVNVYRTPRG